MIGKILSLLFGAFSKGEGATKAAGIGGGLAFYSALIGAGLYLLGPGRDLSFGPFNLLEVCAVLLVGVVAGLVLLRLPPPGSP